MKKIYNENKKFMHLKKNIKKEIDNIKMPLSYQFIVKADSLPIYHGISESSLHSSENYNVGFFYKPISVINFDENE